MNRDEKKRLKFSSSVPVKIAAELGLRVEAKQTSTSGRWVSLFCEHRHDALPCYVVLNINNEGWVDQHHFGTVEAEGTTYEDSRDLAKQTARKFYDELAAKLQEKPQTSLAEEQNHGLKIINPDGSEEDYNFVN